MNHKDFPTLRQAAQLTLDAIEQGVSFDHLDNVIAPMLRKALTKPDPNRQDFSKVKTITLDGKCLGWDGNEVNMAP